MSIDLSRRNLALLTGIGAGAVLASQQAKADTVFTAFQYPSTLPNGTGTTPGSPAQTTPQRLGVEANVKDFGAKGDNSTDDTTAIQAAVNWQTANGVRGGIYFPTGRYIISSAITIPNGSFNIRGEGDASAILGAFDGFIFDQFTNPYSPNGQGIVIEKLNLVNGYPGQNANTNASTAWSAGSNVNITVPGLPAFVAVNCLVYIIDQQIAPMPVFVGITTVVSGTTITIGTAAVGSSTITNLNLAFVQSYAAGASWSNHATTITMPGSPPAGVPVGCKVYDYDRMLAGDGTVQNVWLSNLGVGTWSGTTLTFTEGVNQASVGSADRLVFSPLSGCVRLSSTVSGTVRDCVMSGFVCITTSQDDVNTSGQQRGAESYSIIVQGNSLSTSANAAAIGNTGIYLTNNSISLCNDVTGFWCGTRLSGTANSIVAGRTEVCSYGIVMGQGENQDNPVLSASLIAGASLESNLFSIVIAASHCLLTGISILCQNSNGQYGIYAGIGVSVIEASSIQGNWQGYAIYIPDAGNGAGQLAVVSTVAANNFGGGLGAWRIPAQAWWGTCIQCNNPALVYTFANLPTGSGSPTPTEGDQYNISDCSTSTFLATAAATGTGAAAHRLVRWNAVSSLWQVVG